MGLKNKKCMWLYLISMICIIVSTYAAKIIAPSLDFIGYSLMRPFFTELITALLWIVEIWVICHIYSKKMSYPIFQSPTESGYELPKKKVVMITVIVSAVIILIGAQIRFQVKPLYDLGEKFTGYDVYYYLGLWGRNAIKSFWIVIMLKAAHDCMDDFVSHRAAEKGDFIHFIPWAGICMICTLGIADLLMKSHTLPVTYLFLYLVYDELYLLTEHHMIKTLLLVLFLILF